MIEYISNIGSKVIGNTVAEFPFRQLIKLLLLFREIFRLKFIYKFFFFKFLFITQSVQIAFSGDRRAQLKINVPLEEIH